MEVDYVKWDIPPTWMFNPCVFVNVECKQTSPVLRNKNSFSWFAAKLYFWLLLSSKVVLARVFFLVHFTNHQLLCVFCRLRYSRLPCSLMQNYYTFIFISYIIDPRLKSHRSKLNDVCIVNTSLVFFTIVRFRTYVIIWFLMSTLISCKSILI